MNTKHTPGPWAYHHDEHDGFDGPSVQSEFGIIVHMPTPEDAEGVMNAHLIAAAPELLEALKLCVEAWDCDGEPSACGYEHAVDRARQAIAKAEGR